MAESAYIYYVTLKPTTILISRPRYLGGDEMYIVKRIQGRYCNPTSLGARCGMIIFIRNLYYLFLLYLGCKHKCLMIWVECIVMLSHRLHLTDDALISQTRVFVVAMVVGRMIIGIIFQPPAN